jgi:hypothetical protein
MYSQTRILQFLTLASLTLAIHTSSAASLPASAEIYNTSQGTAVVKTEEAAQITVDGESLAVQFPAGSNYPAINFSSSDGSWDMSGYDAVEAVIVNTGTAPLRLGLRVDNPGHWKQKPWSSGNLEIDPGQTKIFTLPFGTQYGHPTDAFNPADITNVKLMAISPKSGSQLQLNSIKAIQLGGNSQSSAPSAIAPNISTVSDITIYNTAQGTANLKVEEAAEVSVASDGLTINFPAGSKYPAVNFETSAGSWDMSGYTAVEAVIKNTGTTSIRLGLRIDNEGHWKNKPWSTDHLTIAPGDTKKFTVNFGIQYGKQSGVFDPSKVINVKLMAISPKAGSKILITSIKPIIN